MEKELAELVMRLKEAAGPNLKSVVLYGSAATGEFHPKYSDLNLLCVLERLDPVDLEKLNPAVRAWLHKGYPTPLVFTLEALRRSADVFPIELLDIKASRRVLFGEDVFADLEVPLNLHRPFLERELRTNLIRLRERYLARSHDRKALLRLMTASVSTFAALFRHVLIILGEQPPQRRRDVFDKLATRVGLEAAAFHAILDVREGKRREKQMDVVETFRAYLEGITRVTKEIDRLLGGR